MQVISAELILGENPILQFSEARNSASYLAVSRRGSKGGFAVCACVCVCVCACVSVCVH